MKNLRDQIYNAVSRCSKNKEITSRNRKIQEYKARRILGYDFYDRRKYGKIITAIERYLDTNLGKNFDETRSNFMNTFNKGSGYDFTIRELFNSHIEWYYYADEQGNIRKK
jgi:hypothetical protein